MGTVTLEQIKELAGKKGQRVKTLAKHFEVPAYEIEKLINLPDSGLERVGRGWITLKK
jgi:hypothetical protein